MTNRLAFCQEIPRQRSYRCHLFIARANAEYFIGYKVGRVDQAETALGAEMRMAADKEKGKVSEDKGKDKIVRRCACLISPFKLICPYHIL